MHFYSNFVHKLLILFICQWTNFHSSVNALYTRDNKWWIPFIYSLKHDMFNSLKPVRQIGQELAFIRILGIQIDQHRSISDSRNRWEHNMKENRWYHTENFIVVIIIVSLASITTHPTFYSYFVLHIYLQTV